MSRWENKAKILYGGTQWERAAISAGRAMDNRLNFIATGPYGSSAPSSFFDMSQYLAFFDYEVLVRRGVGNKVIESLS